MIRGFHRLGLGLAIALALGTATTSRAAIITFSAAVPLTALTDADPSFDTSVTIPLFDPSLGSLMAITFTLNGLVQGSLKFENLDDSPAIVTGAVASTITLFRPDNSEIVAIMPQADIPPQPVTAYDGDTDYDGTSGKTFTGLSDTDSAFITSPPPLSDLALFTGLGSIILPVNFQRESFVSGGDTVAEFETAVSATVDVTYFYTPGSAIEPIPEPSTMTIFALGGVSCVFGRIRRRRPRHLPKRRLFHKTSD